MLASMMLLPHLNKSRDFCDLCVTVCMDENGKAKGRTNQVREIARPLKYGLFFPFIFPRL